MRIYLVRHGETSWNVEMRIQGQQVSPSLNHNGITQARNCAEYFNDLTFDKVYSSNLMRAIETAKIITGGRYDLLKTPEFNERGFGEWETQLWSDIYKQTSDITDILTDNNCFFKAPGGESFNDLIDRTQTKFSQIIEKDKHLDNILIVAHGGPLRAILGYVFNMENSLVPTLVEQDNCCINIIDYSDGFKVKLINYVHAK